MVKPVTAVLEPGDRVKVTFEGIYQGTSISLSDHREYVSVRPDNCGHHKGFCSDDTTFEKIEAKYEHDRVYKDKHRTYWLYSATSDTFTTFGDDTRYSPTYFYDSELERVG